MKLYISALNRYCEYYYSNKQTIIGLAALYQAWCMAKSFNLILFQEKGDEEEFRAINRQFQEIIQNPSEHTKISQALIEMEKRISFIHQIMDKIDKKAIAEGIDTGFSPGTWSPGVIAAETLDSFTKFRCFHIPFAHREDGYKDFITEFKKRYPDRLISHKDTIKEVRGQFEESYKRNIEKMQEIQKKKKEKEREKTTKELPEPTNSVDAKKCYEFVLDTPEVSWNARTALFEGNISRNTLQKQAIEYAFSIEDYEFIKTYSSKAFVLSNFPQEAKKLF